MKEDKNRTGTGPQRVPNGAIRSVGFDPGSTWKVGESRVAVLQQLSAEEVVVSHLASGLVERLSVGVLVAVHEPLLATPISSLERHTSEQWETAFLQAKAIDALIDASGKSPLPDERKATAASLGLGDRQLRRKMHAYTTHGTVAALLPKLPGPERGTTLLDPRVERLVADVIDSYLKMSPDVAVDDILPDINDAVARLDPLPARGASVGRATVQKRLTAARRNRSKLASSIGAPMKYLERQVRYPIQTAGPLDTLEIDHTVVDAHIIEPKTGRSIGRPVLTIAISRATRVIHGMLLSLEAPSRLSVALCLHHAVFPKRNWLEKLGIPDACFPGYGLIRGLHSDNASEFKAHSHIRGLALYKIKAEYRDEGDPADGGIVERCIGTLMRKVRLIPGRSYSDLLGRTPRHACKGARMTLGELELYIARVISRYHKTRHSGLGMPPLTAWEDAWRVGGKLVYPQVPENETRFLLTFLPGEWRTVTREGIELFGLKYQSHLIAPFIAKHKKWMVRYDPRDISGVFLEVEGEHIYVPSLRLGGAAISLWEWREIRTDAIAHGRDRCPAQIASEVRKNRELVEEVAKRGRKQAGPRRLARQEEWQRDNATRLVKEQEEPLDRTLRLVWSDL